MAPQAYSALLFNNCLDNGEPDERSQHEGVSPLTQTKYAINGWMRAKHLGGGGTPTQKRKKKPDALAAPARRAPG